MIGKCRDCYKLDELRASDNKGNVYCCARDGLDLGRLHNNIIDSHTCKHFRARGIELEGCLSG